MQENGVAEITGKASDLLASVPQIHSNPHDLLVANEPTFVQHGQEPESETVRQRESTLQRVSSTRASALRSPYRMGSGGHGDPSTVIGTLRKSMYGTRDTGANLEIEFISCLIQAGWVQGIACPNIFCKRGHGHHCRVPRRRCTCTG